MLFQIQMEESASQNCDMGPSLCVVWGRGVCVFPCQDHKLHFFSKTKWGHPQN